MEEKSLEELKQEEKEIINLLRQKAFDMQMKKVGLYIGSEEEQRIKQLAYRTLQQEIKDLKRKIVKIKSEILLIQGGENNEENIRR